MRIFFSGVLRAAVAVGLTQTAVALACGASAPPYYAVAQQAPSGAATPLNAPLLVTLREDPSVPVVQTSIHSSR